jgi:threonylcarbamoyladenosine tRNA methylthiotransferase MtaB
MRIYFHTFGCKTNQYDTEAVRQALESAGAVSVDAPEHADVAVVNSCTVTHVGEAKMRSFVRRLHRRRPELDTVVMGCAAALDDGTIAGLPGVTSVLGGVDPAAVLDAVGLAAEPIDPILRAFPRGARAWVKIQDGCDEHCTFCATTVARGANRSRPIDEIVREAQVLGAHHQEIVLTGVHIGTYGGDLHPATSLGTLVEELVARAPGPRFRVSSVEATEVDERLMELLTGAPDRLASHLHAPLQSGSDRVLRRMGRHWYTNASYRSRCEALAARLSTFGLGADVIVGFPGETDEDHRATCALIEDLPFTYLHVFPYSERPDASSQRIGPPVQPEVVAVRAAGLRDLADRKAAAYRERRDGGMADVVVLGRSRGRVRGLTEDFLDVGFPADRHHAPRCMATLHHTPDGNLAAEPATGQEHVA